MRSVWSGIGGGIRSILRFYELVRGERWEEKEIEEKLGGLIVGRIALGYFIACRGYTGSIYYSVLQALGVFRYVLGSGGINLKV